MHLINELKRVTETSKTIIGLLITNKANITANVNANAKISDLEYIFIIMENNSINTCTKQNREIMKFKYNSININSELSKILVSNENVDLNTRVIFLDHSIESVIRNFRYKTANKRPDDSFKWYSTE